METFIQRVRLALLAEYIATSLHHVIEGLGLVFEFRVKSLITPITFGIPLLIMLGLLYLYQKTRNKVVLGIFSITAILWWVAGIGLMDGFYNHTLNVLLVYAQVPAQIMTVIYPTYVLPTNGIPCDGVKFSYCTPTPATLFYEASGIMSFIIACFLAVNVYRLIRVQWSNQSTREQELPRSVVVGVCLGLLASFGVVPLLGAYMTTGNVSSLVLALPLMSISALAVVVAMVRLRKGSAT